MLEALTDEQTAIREFGRTPFVRTRNGLRYFLVEDPVFHTDVGEVHRDQCLATFAALHLPLNTPIHLRAGAYSISNLLAESVANFTFDQHEPAWTGMAYAAYLPPQRAWTNRFGERTSFSEMTDHLMLVDLKSQSCAGTHIFQVLAQIENADQKRPILDSATKGRLDSYLTGKLQEAMRSQLADGSWNYHWCRSMDAKDYAPTNEESRILVTGHLLEVIMSLKGHRPLPAQVYCRAANWVAEALRGPEIIPSRELICPVTHAARMARSVFASEQMMSDLSGDGTFHPAE